MGFIDMEPASHYYESFHGYFVARGDYFARGESNVIGCHFRLPD